MKKDFMRLKVFIASSLCITLLVLISCSGGGGSSSGGGRTVVTEAPLVDTTMNAETVIDVPNTVVASQKVSTAGGTIRTEDATLIVPPGAVASDTKIEITRLETSFNMNPYAPSESGAVSAIPIGWVMDFGPAGVKFDKPVEITIPYDPDALTDKHSKPVLVYWTGKRWLLLGGAVDPVAHTISVKLNSFDGVVLEAAAIAAAVGIWTYVAIKWSGRKDPVTENKAREWITPDDARVIISAAMASVDGIDISDETNLAKHMESLNGVTSSKITLPPVGGKTREFRFSVDNGANWQKPADFLDETPTGKNFEGVNALGGMRGDCTDATNALVSMFRSLGYQAKGVYGYVVDKNSPHAWAEVIIGGKPYIIDNQGKIQRFEEAIKNQQLIRPDSSDWRNVMWDENGQEPYKEEWWKTSTSNYDVEFKDVYANPSEYEGAYGGYRTVDVRISLSGKYNRVVQRNIRGSYLTLNFYIPKPEAGKTEKYTITQAVKNVKCWADRACTVLSTCTYGESIDSSAYSWQHYGVGLFPGPTYTFTGGDDIYLNAIYRIDANSSWGQPYFGGKPVSVYFYYDK